MSLLKQINETAAAGSISSGDVAVNQGTGFSKGDQELGTPKKKKRIKNLFKDVVKESKEIDKISVMSKIRNAEANAEGNDTLTVFGLEDSDGNIIKVSVKNEQRDEFEKALEDELRKNKDDVYKHREIAEIIYDLRNDFDIVNIDWKSDLPEDEEENVDIGDDTGETPKDDVDIGDDTGETPKDDVDIGDDTAKDDTDDFEKIEDEMEPPKDSTKSALDAVIDMMKADAEAKKAEAEAKEKEAEARIADLRTKEAEAVVKKTEKVLDMEAYNEKKAAKAKEEKELLKLAKYQHEINNDTNSETSDVDLGSESDLDFGTEEEEVNNNLLKNALLALLQDRVKRD